jgi:phosphopentomutase
MSGRFILVIIDSFGVGAMPDTATCRPQDQLANTALHVLQANPNLTLPNLTRLGLMNLLNTELPQAKFSPVAIFGSCALAHQGADSFLGHQEIMGINPPVPITAPFNTLIQPIEQALQQAGFSTRRYGLVGQEILVVNEVCTVGDNLETDLGMVYNVTGALDLIPFPQLLEIGRIVRSIASVGRVITFGGQNVCLDNLLNACQAKGLYAGVSAPDSGVYRQGYQVLHLGYGIDHRQQVQTALAQQQIPVALLGKAADIIYHEGHLHQTGVDTATLMQLTLDRVNSMDRGFICVNIQESDLAGHAQDAQRYAEILATVDTQLAPIMQAMTADDVLIVMADHGNDPTIGHSNHTRENVPLLIYRPTNTSLIDIGNRSGMADVAATIADYFGVQPPQSGQSFWKLIQ